MDEETANEDTDPNPVSFDVTINDGQTTITISGDRDAAVVVRSAAGERIYLPPEDFERPPESASSSPYDSPYSSPYSSPYDSPYEGTSSPYDSPYESSREQQQPTTGMEPTANGFRIVHPEPVTDLRLLR